LFKRGAGETGSVAAKQEAKWPASGELAVNSEEIGETSEATGGGAGLVVAGPETEGERAGGAELPAGVVQHRAQRAEADFGNEQQDAGRAGQGDLCQLLQPPKTDVLPGVATHKSAVLFLESESGANGNLVQQKTEAEEVARPVHAAARAALRRGNPLHSAGTAQENRE